MKQFEEEANLAGQTSLDDDSSSSGGSSGSAALITHHRPWTQIYKCLVLNGAVDGLPSLLLLPLMELL